MNQNEFNYYGIVREVTYSQQALLMAESWRQGTPPGYADQHGDVTDVDQRRANEYGNLVVALGRLKGAMIALQSRKDELSPMAGTYKKAMEAARDELSKLSQEEQPAPILDGTVGPTDA